MTKFKPLFWRASNENKEQKTFFSTSLISTIAEEAKKQGKKENTYR